MIYNCCNQNRKAAVIGKSEINGIDYLEVLDSEAIALGIPRQRTLLVHCLNPLTHRTWSVDNILIEGGESVTGITVDWVETALATSPPSPAPATSSEQEYYGSLPDAANVLVIRTHLVGDFSPYELRLVNSASQAALDPFGITEVLDGFDPQLAAVTFSFKVECGANFDCAPPAPDCQPTGPAPPPINYLAKDYGSFRTIMLDRLNQLLPSWGGSTEADLGIALAEVIAYVGDRLSYQQDAVATEAYLETARSRVSLRRHALLVDYHVHDGCNARAWIQLQVSEEVSIARKAVRFCTDVPGMPSDLKVGSGNEEAALLQGVIAFEPMEDAVLYPEQNRISIYTWGDDNCCLPQGATEATLAGSLTSLQPGDVLIFQEVAGPQTGQAADADIRHRWAVRLTQVATQDASGNPLQDALLASSPPFYVTEIQWAEADALPFPLCLSSSYLDSSGDTQTVAEVSVAFGNVVLADHGMTMSSQTLETVPEPWLAQPPDPAADRCQPSSPVLVPVRYQPVLPDSPLTQAAPLALAGTPVTPGVVSLLPNGFVSLTDTNGSTCLMIEAANPLSWPKYFEVTVGPSSNPGGDFDLSISFIPSGNPMAIPLEKFSAMSLSASDPNFAPARINALSKFIKVNVPLTYTRPSPSPGFAAAPQSLADSGVISFQDSGGNTFLIIEPISPLAWPPCFGVLSYGDQQAPDQFDLLVVYDPPSGGVGVQIPVVVEEITDLTLATAAGTFNSKSFLVSVISFDQEPAPNLSASDLMSFDPSTAVPAISLSGTDNDSLTSWTCEQDLLESGPTDPNFVVEIETDGTARLRFGDNANGQRPDSWTSFTASYRIGNGAAGNVGPDSLVVPAGTDARIMTCTNPLPATGGTEPETAEQIRRRAPQAFMTQERAITMTDYEAVAENDPRVDRAVASLRWTGSWHTVFIAAEPAAADNLSPALSQSLASRLNQFRLAGQDIQLESPQYVPLQIELTVCVDANYFASDVEQTLLQVLGSQTLPNGQKGLFYPDSFDFGKTVYLSTIYAAARTVAGVASVTATTFQPQGAQGGAYLANGEIPMEAFQIARMDNDPSFPNHGQLRLKMEGGK